MRAKSNSPSPAQRQVQAGARITKFLSVSLHRQTCGSGEGLVGVRYWSGGGPMCIAQGSDSTPHTTLTFWHWAVPICTVHGPHSPGEWLMWIAQPIGIKALVSLSLAAGEAHITFSLTSLYDSRTHSPSALACSCNRPPSVSELTLAVGGALGMLTWWRRSF